MNSKGDLAIGVIRFGTGCWIGNYVDQADAALCLFKILWHLCSMLCGIR